MNPQQSKTHVVAVMMMQALFSFLTLVTGPRAAEASDDPRACSSIFQDGKNVLVRLQRVVDRSRNLQDPVLSETEMSVIFEGSLSAPFAGSRALRQMKSLPSTLSSTAKAQAWLDMMNYLDTVKRISFSSTMFLLGEERYLFRGGQAEALFIDSDGAVYRLSTTYLIDGGRLELIYRNMKRINDGN